MPEKVKIVSWCWRDDCYDRVDKELQQYRLYDTPESYSVSVDVSSVEEIKGLIDSGDIELLYIEKVIVDYGIMDNVGDEYNSIIDVLDEIAKAMGKPESDRKSICCLVLKDLDKAGAIEENGYTAIV